MSKILTYVSLIAKYDRPVPRYTSYPTLPCWQSEAPSQEAWLAAVNHQLIGNPEISLYIHLPFCERLCTFCGCNKRITKKHEVEHPYIDAVLAEWRIYVHSLGQRPRLKELHLGGGTPTFFSPSALSRLLHGILRHADVADDYSFGLEAHPNSTTKEHLETLADLGFNRLSIGIQDFSPHILQLINRKQSEADIFRCVEEARAAGYSSINFDILYGLPTQQQSDIVNTITKVNQLRPERIAFYGYAHVPWVSPGQRAYDESHLPRGAAKWDLYLTGKKMLEAQGYKDIGLDHFSLPEDDLYKALGRGELHRNFMGYTTANTPVTIALGCSSIGDSWDTYVQNEKKVETYQQILLFENRLPIIKGHQLNEEDQIVRRHILNLMCQGHTDWRSENMRCNAVERAVHHWDDMAADGIVRRSPYHIEVTDTGKPFLRNICLPLDDHYWRKQPEDTTFSQAI
ncbi:MAG: oxygen-independent coproporphyrinogen-3 oxidase [Neolewinella sp.]